MRQADINRVNKAKEHLSAAMTILCNIKWENVNQLEYELRHHALEEIVGANHLLADILNIQDFQK